MFTPLSCVLIVYPDFPGDPSFQFSSDKSDQDLESTGQKSPPPQKKKNFLSS